MKKDYKIIFIDIDQTLRNDEKQVTERTRKSIEQIKSLGVTVVLCTGRSRGIALEISKESMTSPYIIDSSGAEVYDVEKDRSIFATSISKEDCCHISEISKKYKLQYFINSGPKRAVNHSMRLHGDEVILEDMDQFIKDNRIDQFVLTSSNYDEIRLAMAELEALEGVTLINRSKCFDNPNLPIPSYLYCDVVATNTSKGTAVKKLCEYLNIPVETSIGIGDNLNDIQMLEAVNLKVAMGNSVDRIKEKANIITASNNEDGVALFLEDLYNELKK